MDEQLVTVMRRLILNKKKHKVTLTYISALFDTIPANRGTWKQNKRPRLVPVLKTAVHKTSGR